MSKNKARSADLIMKLYDLRREATMREARNWFVGFFPESADDVTAAMMHPDSSAFYRMVITYWDMAASFVNHGAINEEMFLESGGEAILVFAKIQPFLEEIRTKTGNPNYIKHLADLILKQPDAEQMLAARREYLKNIIAKRAELAKTAT
ncbi:MAG: hypothetical protein ABI791_03430 [Acidobacteriota bacterium]